MLVDQKMYVNGNDVVLKNTFDIGGAKELVREANLEGGSRNSNVHCIGHIPPEMWNFDPWLLMARKASLAGDKGEYHKYVMKFFEVHPCFKIDNRAKYFQGGLSL